MAHPKLKFDWRFLALLPIPLLWCLAAHLGWLDGVERLMLDRRFQFRGPIDAPVKLLYVDVDQRAVKLIGEKPWNRARFADAGRAVLEKGGAKAVAYDFVFSNLGRSELVPADSSKPGNLALGRLGRKYPQVVFAAQYTLGESVTLEGARLFPLLRLGFTDRAKNDVPELPEYPMVNPVSSVTIGLIDFDYGLGGDSTPRWGALFAESNVPTFWHMAVQLACIELGLPPSSARRAGDFVELVGEDGVVRRRIPVVDEQLLEVNWFSPWLDAERNPRTSMADVLLAAEMLAGADPKARAEAEEYFQRFAGAIVLIGPTDVLLQDLAPTPFDSDPVPKVGAHGNLLKTILAEKYLVRWPAWTVFALTLVLASVVTMLSMIGGPKGLWSKLAAAAVLGGYAWAAFAAFKGAHLVLPFTAPLSGAFTMAFAGVMWQLLREEKQKGRIKGMFGAYVSPELVDRMVESEADPQLGGHDAEITAYFSDIQSFSSFSEKLGSGPLVELMNEYLTACTDIVQAEGGTLDKYIGDAIVAMFGAPIALPDHALRACIASQKVHHKLAELRAKWRAETGKWPPIVHNMQTRIGLNSGVCMIGNMGSRTRFNYTMMGDNVNLAARMESGAKQFGVYTMVAEATKLACEQHGGDRVVFRQLDKIIVKGRSQPVTIFEIVGLKENVAPATHECLGLWRQAIDCYLAQDFDGASAIAQRTLPLEPNLPGRDPGVESNPSLWLASRCAYMKEHPPGPGWDGVFKMKEK